MMNSKITDETNVDTASIINCSKDEIPEDIRH